VKLLLAIIAAVVIAWAWLFLSNKGILVSSEVITEDRVGRLTEALGIQGVGVEEQRLVCTYFTGAGTVERSYSLTLGEHTCLNVLDLR
jgi:hypothetical protein